MATQEDYQYELNGLLLGHNTPWFMTKVEGLFSLPDVVVSDTQREGMDGEYSSNDEVLAGRTISMEFAMLGDTSAANDADTLYEILQASTSNITGEVTLLIKRPNRPERLLRVKVRRRAFTSDYEFAMGRGAGALQLKALDPLIYEAEPRVLPPTDLFAVAGGRTYPSAKPRVYGVGQRSGLLDMPNIGSWPTGALLRIDGPVTNPVLEHQPSGRQLGFTYVIPVGDFFLIDLKEKTILQSGTTNRRSALTTAQWFMIQPGANTIRFTGTAGAGTPRLSAVWSSAWA